jgi:hypothetical protein
MLRIAKWFWDDRLNIILDVYCPDQQLTVDILENNYNLYRLSLCYIEQAARG